MTYPTLTLPPIDQVVPGADPAHPNPADSDVYNAHCTDVIRFALGQSEYIRTHYPYDLPDGSSDDTLTLGDDGEIVVVDPGVQ